MHILGSRDSEVINAIKFILIVCVVYIHILPNVFVPITSELSGQNLFHFFTESFSHNFCRVAVPAFFVLSGFFFFSGISETQGEWTFFVRQWKKRLSSLFVPYLLWNLLYLAIIIVKNRIFIHFGFQTDDFYYQVKTMGLFWILWKMPIDFPLWYVRDLMCMVVLAPLFYFVIKRLGYWGIILLGLWYFSTLETNIPGFSSTAFFYFGLGAYFGCKNKNILDVSSRFGRTALWIGIPLLVVASVLNGTVFQEYLVRLFCPFGIIMLFDIARRLPDTVIQRLSGLSVTVFFILATHQIYILNWTKGLFGRLFGSSVLSQGVTYVFAPIVVLLVCVLAFYLMRHIAPRSLAISIGNRKQ